MASLLRVYGVPIYGVPIYGLPKSEVAMYGVPIYGIPVCRNLTLEVPLVCRNLTLDVNLRTGTVPQRLRTKPRPRDPRRADRIAKTAWEPRGVVLSTAQKEFRT